MIFARTSETTSKIIEMATADPLQLLRTAIAAEKPPSLTTSSDPSTAESSQTDSFLEATHLYFSHPSQQCLALNTKTRFVSTNPDTAEVDVRSIWLAWLNRETNISDYLAKASELNTQLSEGQKVRNLIFIERLGPDYMAARRIRRVGIHQAFRRGQQLKPTKQPMLLVGQVFQLWREVV